MEPVAEIKQPIAPPPQELLDVMILQLESAIQMFNGPLYVNEAATNFIEALKRWGKEGQ